MRRTGSWSASLLLVAAACHPRAGEPGGNLAVAAHAITEEGASARTWALAGFNAFLVEGDPTQAQQRMDRAIQLGPADPYALVGQLFLARRRAHPEAALAAALTLCERNPKHPLAALAARYALDLAGTSTALDDAILSHARSALAAGAPGDAAHLLRSAIATIQGQRGDDSGQDVTLAEMGFPTSLSLWGPFSAYRVLSFDASLPPETTGALDGAMTGPLGPLVRRTLTFPDGRWTLSGEVNRGDIYLLAVDFDVAESAAYVVRAVSSASYKVDLDLEPLLERRAFESATSTVAAQGVHLSEGAHRLILKLSRGDHDGAVNVAVMRQDGAPAHLHFRPAAGALPALAASRKTSAKASFPGAEGMYDALKDEAGVLLATFLAGQDGVARDREGVKRLLAAVSDPPKIAPFLELKAQVALADHSLPTKVAHGRATRDLEAAVMADPHHVLALTQLAAMALDEGRTQEAFELIDRARAAHSPVGFPVPLLSGKAFLSVNVDAQADASAREAISLQPGLCEAGLLAYDLARRRDAASASDGLLRQLEGCPASRSRAAEHAKARGNNEAAIQQYQRVFARDPTHVPTAMALSSLLLAQRRNAEAAAVLDALAKTWPRDAQVLKRRADIAELTEDLKGATALREQALALDGSDLTLRRQVSRARTGAEPLQAYAVPGKQAIAEYESQRGDEDAASAYVLDFAAIQIFPDGSSLDRIHIIQKALDQNGVQEIAEVSVPSGAQVLTLQTVKADGTILEPERIDEKDSTSLPGVQVGDYVEYEFLEAHPARDLGEPGFSASNFYFQVANAPNNRSHYVVIAPASERMTVDAHNMPADAPQRQGDQDIYVHEARHVPPFISEPNAPPNANEVLPFVSVGAGARGNDGLAAEYADNALEHGQLTEELRAFAKAAAADKEGVEALRAVYAAVMQKIEGRDSGLSMSAASSLAQDRGSRLWLLKAALEALGFKPRLVAIRTFASDPAPYVFPTDSLLQYVCVRVELPDGTFVWLDPAVRFAPFGELPEQAAGGREAYLLPEPGRPLEHVKTPAAKPVLGKDVSLVLELKPDGQLTGTGRETYYGFDAAQLREALEELAPDERDQALQRALSRYFGGANLSSVKLDLKHEVGAPLNVTYQFTAARYGRRDGTRMVLGPLTYPLQVGERYVRVGTRKTPLFVESTESVRAHATLQLPPGYFAASLVPQMSAGGAFGSFVRHERQEGHQLEVDEELRLGMQRIPAAKYEDFTQFAGEVDLVQGRDLVLEGAKSVQGASSSTGAGARRE